MRRHAWVRPLADAGSAALAGHDAHDVASALVAVSVGYARVSVEGREAAGWGAADSWNRCYDVEAPRVRTNPAPWALPATLAPRVEAIADAWLRAVSAQRERWAAVGSPWADQIGSAQVAALALLVAARVLQSTRTGYAAWRAALVQAWGREMYALEVAA